MSRHGDNGLSSPLLVAMLAILVLGLGGVSADLWRVVAAHRELVGHADAAAAAGATAIDEAALYADPLDHRLDRAEALLRTCNRLARMETLSTGGCPGPHIEVDVAATRVSLIVERDVKLDLLGLLVPGESPSVTVRVVSTVDVIRGRP